MKKILFLISIVLAASYLPQKVNAQVTFSQTTFNPTGAISNTGIDTMTYPLTKGYLRLQISMTYTRSANTGAGTAILEYRVHPNDSYKSDLGDTLTVQNAATQTLYWNKTNCSRYWRIRVGGATTVTATVQAHLQTN